ncbi:unnamed protein product [Symbiodinium sp. CCMP2592]|nr:unnamed protein product [Symbiodinium sp. CCMP2592]
MLELRLRACSSIPALKHFASRSLPFFAFSMNRFGGSHPLRDLARGLRYAQAGLGSGPTTPSLGPGPAVAVIDPPAQNQADPAANAGDGQPAAVPDPAPAVAASNMATPAPVSTATPAPVPAAAPADPPGGYLATSKAASGTRSGAGVPAGDGTAPAAPIQPAPPMIQTKAVPKHPPTTGGLPSNPPAAAAIPPASADTRPADSGQQASGSGQPASGSEPRPAEWMAPPYDPDRERALRQVMLEFLPEADDDLVYSGLADLQLSQASRLLVLLSEVCQDNFYALANLGQYDVEAPISVLAAQSTRPGSVPGQYRPVGARSMPEGPRLPDREGAEAIRENLARPQPSFPPIRIARTDTRDIALDVPLVHCDRNRPSVTPQFDPDAPLTPRRINTGPWNKSEGWMRLSICLPDSPGPFVRDPDTWPYPDLFCFELEDLPPWVPIQQPPSGLTHLRIRNTEILVAAAWRAFTGCSSESAPVRPSRAPLLRPGSSWSRVFHQNLLHLPLVCLTWPFPAWSSRPWLALLTACVCLAGACALGRCPSPARLLRPRLDFFSALGFLPVALLCSLVGRPSSLHPYHGRRVSVGSSSKSPLLPDAGGDTPAPSGNYILGSLPLASASDSGSSMAAAAEAALVTLRAAFCDAVQDLGDDCTLWLHTKLVPSPRELQTRAVAKFAPSTLTVYLRLWSAWVLHCRRFGFSCSDPASGTVPDWLHRNAAPSGLATSAFKSLSWMSRIAGLPSLAAQLQTPLCTAFLTATIPIERRESLPFSVSFVAWLERRVMCPDTPARDALVMGSVLCLIWSSLRWNDGLWSPPGRLVLQYDSSAVTGLATRTKSCRASMPWGCQLFGLTGGPSACWGLSWLNGHPTPFPRPVRGFSIALACSGYRILGHGFSFAPVAGHALAPGIVGRTLGHHRPSAMEGSVRVYSRDDVGPMLLLQSEVINRIRSGFRPLQPVARGASRPLPDFRVSLPPPDRHMAGEAPKDVPPRSRSPVPHAKSSAAAPVDDVPELSADSSDSDVSTASASDVDTSVPAKPKLAVRPKRPAAHTSDDLRAFLVNPRSNIVHKAVEVLLVRVPATNHMAADYPATSYTASSQQAPAPDVWHTFRAARGHDGAVLLPSVPELVDLEELSDEDLLAMLRRCSAGFLARLARLIGRILRPVPQVVTCHLPCVNPECNQVCGRVIDVTRRRQHRNHACRVCHSFGW